MMRPFNIRRAVQNSKCIFQTRIIGDKIFYQRLTAGVTRLSRPINAVNGHFNSLLSTHPSVPRHVGMGHYNNCPKENIIYVPDCNIRIKKKKNIYKCIKLNVLYIRVLYLARKCAFACMKAAAAHSRFRFNENRRRASTDIINEIIFHINITLL